MKKISDVAKEVFKIESQAIADLEKLLTSDFEKVIECLLYCKGRVVICGIGKSGLVGKKIAATLASTGTPSFFLHPSEALHGDIGTLMSEDCFISISNSGETDEILQLMPHLKKMQIPHIALTGKRESTLAKNARWVLNIGIKEEASPLSAVPMASTIATMAMGDAIAAALITLKKFSEKDFARNHPGGTLGKKLVTEVGNIMKRDNLPIADLNSPVKEVLVEMSSGMFGMVVIVDHSNKVLGVITDGDLRRALNKFPENSFFQLSAKDLMTTNPETVQETCLLFKADQIMRELKITTLPVIKEGLLIGLIAKHQIK